MAIHFLGAAAGAAVIAATTWSLLASNPTPASTNTAPVAKAIPPSTADALSVALMASIPTSPQLNAAGINSIAQSVVEAAGVSGLELAGWQALLADYSRAYRCLHYQYDRWYMKGVIDSTASAVATSDAAINNVRTQMGTVSRFLSMGVVPSLADCAQWL